MADIDQRLQEHLGNAYTVERELLGGGMSRVFVARDRALDRLVVIKILPPAMAATLSVDRFKREIMFSASLQHPNIVPVLSAGELDGLPYFIMPYISGESLRTRLTRGPLSVRETVTVMKDVARALGYAHGKGVIHRDIKPDNILLSSGTAVVTDFGVAKALAASRAMATSGAPSGVSTGVGVSFGTPQYMAPEQAAADPNTDHRADLYALGIVSYEMLAGAAPFSGRSPQALLTAQLTEVPAAITQRRYDVPAPLSDLIARLLEKAPNDRPRSATDVVRALDAPGIASDPTAHADRAHVQGASRVPTYIAGAVLITLAAAAYVRWRPAPPAAAAAAAALLSPAPPALPSSIAVLPLATIGRARQDLDLAAGMSSALTTAVSRVPGMRVASETAARAASATRAQHAVRDIADSLHVGLLVEGTLQRQGDRLRVNVRVFTAANDSTIWASTFDGATNDVFRLQDTMTQAVAAALAVRQPAVSSTPAGNR